MNELPYKQLLNLTDAIFSRIEHVDAMVADVFRVQPKNGSPLILKVCSRNGDYRRELFFLKYFAGRLPVPEIVRFIEPSDTIHGAILMKCIPGEVLRKEALTTSLAAEAGKILATIHSARVALYGDLTDANAQSQDPRSSFRQKFEEGMQECTEHLPEPLLKRCWQLFERDINLLKNVDGRIEGPCIIHRDFRPGNVLVEAGMIQGVIDWSAARGGFAEEDFVPFEWGDDPALQESFLAGYASIRTIPNYKRLMSLLRLSKAIASIGFTVKRGTWNSCHAEFYKKQRQVLE